LIQVGEISYEYDAMNRLTEVDLPEELEALLPDEEYSCDETGNRLTSRSGRKMDPATREPETLDYSYNFCRPDILESDGVFSYTYDAVFNITSRTSIETGDRIGYEYDVYDRLAGMKKFRADGAGLFSEIAYGYGRGGRRVFKDVDGTVTRYACAVLDLAASMDAQGETLAVWRHDGPRAAAFD